MHALRPYADNTLDVALRGRSSQGWYFDNLDATWEQMYVPTLMTFFGSP